MSLDGNGTYSPPAPQFPAIPNTIIYADDFNQIILDIATALSTAIFRDGQAAFTANQSMGGNRLTDLANGVNPQDATTVLQVFTDPVFVATTLQGFKITGSMFQALMTTINLVASGAVTLTGTTLLDMSASGQVKLPANTSIGPISASELATLDGITATTAELNKLHGATLSTAELNILAGAVITAADLNNIPNLAPKDSPNLTGIPTAPTAPTGTNSNQIATMAALQAQAFAATLPAQAGNAGKFVSTDGLNAYWAVVRNWGREARTANTQLTANDQGKLIDITSGTFNQTFAAVTALKADWFCYLRNSGTGVITLTPNAGDTIDGGSSVLMYPGDLVAVTCDGAALYSTILQKKEPSFTRFAVITKSGTFTAPITGDYRVTVIGAGASGGVAYDTGATNPMLASGGAAGGTSIKRFRAKAGDNFTATIGAGGASVSRTTTGATNGTAGGTSSFVGGSINVRATGGAAGQAFQGAAGTAAGASGGVGSGGDVNLTGGASGSATALSNAANMYAATGGGAVNITGTAYPSGNASVAAVNQYAGSGGAGIGGKSGNATSTTSRPGAMSAGGGSFGASPDVTNTISTTPGIGISFATIANMLLNGAGTNGAVNTTSGNAGAGAGSGAASANTTGSGAGGIFGGSGGCPCTAGPTTSGAPGYGAGSGAVAAYGYANKAATTAKGGNGIIIVEWGE